MIPPMNWATCSIKDNRVTQERENLESKAEDQHRSEVKGISQRMRTEWEWPGSTEECEGHLEAQWGLFPLLPAAIHSFTWGKCSQATLAQTHVCTARPWMRADEVSPSSLYAHSQDQLIPWGHTPRGILISQLLRTKTTEPSIPSTTDNQTGPHLGPASYPNHSEPHSFQGLCSPAAPEGASYKLPRELKSGSETHSSSFLEALIYILLVTVLVS